MAERHTIWEGKNFSAIFEIFIFRLCATFRIMETQLVRCAIWVHSSSLLPLNSYPFGSLQGRSLCAVKDKQSTVAQNLLLASFFVLNCSKTKAIYHQVTFNFIWRFQARFKTATDCAPPLSHLVLQKAPFHMSAFKLLLWNPHHRARRALILLPLVSFRLIGRTRLRAIMQCCCHKNVALW